MSYYGNLYQNEELSHRAKTVYMYLHDRSDAAGTCWPGVSSGSHQTSSYPAARCSGHWHDLEQAGLVSRQSRYRPNGSLTSNLYQIAAEKGESSQSSAKGGL